jgi:hypothetical protein
MLKKMPFSRDGLLWQGDLKDSSDAEWKLFEDIFPEKERRGRGICSAFHARFLMRCCSCLEPAVGGVMSLSH